VEPQRPPRESYDVVPLNAGEHGLYFSEPQDCLKCEGTGQVDANSAGDTTCFCCNGKGQRYLTDHVRCLRYHVSQPGSPHECVERWMDPAT